MPRGAALCAGQSTCRAGEHGHMIGRILLSIKLSYARPALRPVPLLGLTHAVRAQFDASRALR
jgi:hypothetical protein